MSSLVSFVIPAALGAAWSPLIFASIVEILRNDTPAARRRALIFWMGTIAALLVWAAVFYSAVWTWLRHTAAELEPLLQPVEIVAGVILLVVAAVAWLRWRTVTRVGRELRHPHHHRERERRGTGWFFFGMVMQGRDVSSIVLYIAILARLVASDSALVTKAVVWVACLFVITTVCWLPLVSRVRFHLPSKVRRWDKRARKWLERHQEGITVVVSGILGVALIWHGLWGT